MLRHDTVFTEKHNHQTCIDEALARAKALCRKKQLRFTPIRELVLRLIWQSHKPLGAYDLLPALAEAGFNSAPPTVYRALEFLQEQGLVHRLASLNAFIGCSQPDAEHTGYFFICRECHQTLEVKSDPVHSALNRQANNMGFSIDQETVEVLGTCPSCKRNPDQHA
ncbi:Fur family transcriptional regulator [Nitrincola alkalilacustris]|uniref:Fur family transcriptional regulator n=1 Tax=Nitrincola alkalilacustris TaxID=1571224 RepID=UPI00124DD14D|nr:Fur family transcriptional regulator [Nitrincola alkalilacustris]